VDAGADEDGATWECLRLILEDAADDLQGLWQEHLTEVFDSQVRGPAFEQQARTFVERFASDGTVPGERAHVRPSRLTSRGHEWELDLVVTGDHPDRPAGPSPRSARPRQVIGSAAAISIGSSKRAASSAPVRPRHDCSWSARAMTSCSSRWQTAMTSRSLTSTGCTTGTHLREGPIGGGGIRHS
jgi:hypothetical protein